MAVLERDVKRPPALPVCNSEQRRNRPGHIVKVN
jgi:hypothetical protein